MHDPRIEKLASVLVRYSTQVQPGERVSLIGSPLAEPLVVALYRQVLLAGGHPVVEMLPEACLEVLYRHASQAQLEYVHPLELREAETAQVAIHVLAAENTRSLTQRDPGKLAIRSQARKPLMDLFLRRAAEGSLRWVVTQFPCQAMAQDASMSLLDYEEFVYGAGMLDREDVAAAWRALSDRQKCLADFLASVKELRLATPRGTDLRVRVAGRTWINSDGHENFPDGEVYTAPVEDATEGTIRIDFPTFHAGQEMRGIRLRFRGGRVVEASAEEGEGFLRQVLNQDPGARILGEIALGCNYALTRSTRNTLFDEKIGGTFHVALGASYPRTGGCNRSGLHWDLVCDLRRGGWIEADGLMISQDGRFLRPDWPQPHR